MSPANRPNRKASDEQIIRKNSVGLSLGRIGKELGCHPTTITLRLNSLNIPPADTRRTFMESVWDSLSTDQQEWLADQLGPHTSIKDLIKNLIVKEYVAKTA
jgi:hypothetical protein